MNKIKVKNFGPIKEGFNENDGFLDIKKITVFIGNQGSGKSTVAKLISTCKWLEKAMNRGDIGNHMETFEFRKYCAYQNIHNYFLHDTSEIEYKGEVYTIAYNDKLHFPNVQIIEKESGEYKVPKIMYIPSERNFLSVVRDAFNITGLPPSLFEFAEELRRSQKDLGGETIDLPINGYKYFYEATGDFSIVVSKNDNTNLLEASSGLQSSIPLYLVSRNLALSVKMELDLDSINRMLSARQSIRLEEEMRKVIRDNPESNNERSKKFRKLILKYHNSCFIDIVEEPEQNLFPDSQRHILNSLLGFANRQEANELLMTTHSPYIINYLSIVIQGKYLLDKINASSKKEELLPRLSEIVPIEACIAAADVAIYQFQNDGSICRLESYEGIPSDKNYLNQSLAEGNQLFDALLELEEEL